MDLLRVPFFLNDTTQKKFAWFTASMGKTWLRKSCNFCIHLKKKKGERERYRFVTIHKTFNVFHLLTSVYGSISAIMQRYDAILVSERCSLLIPIYNLCVITFRCCNICMHRLWWLFPNRLLVLGIMRWNFLYKENVKRVKKLKLFRGVRNIVEKD